MSRCWFFVCIALVMAGLSGCAGKSVDRFTLEIDLPPNFKLKTAANYLPATGTDCTLPRRRGKRPERKLFFTDYKPIASRLSYQLPLSETIEGCPTVLRSVQFDIYAKWGTQFSDVGGDLSGISFLDGFDADLPGMPDTGVQKLFGQCRWLFRTVGPQHGIIKILECDPMEAMDQTQKKRVGGSVQRSQLAAKTLRVELALSEEEQPAFADSWVAVPGGWRRCRGKSFEDLYAFCYGDTTHFKPVTMPDGRTCDVYPTCK
ncbi:hypothetical protein ACW9IB_05975 [Pseudomonas sp. SDO524_S393]